MSPVSQAPVSPVIIAVDAGTTGVRALVVDEQAGVVDVAYRELTQHYPRPGWVEHDPDEIWETVRATLAEVTTRLADAGRTVQAVGITNQRETVVAWDRRTGDPKARAIVWQDRRSAPICRAMIEAGHLPMIRARTGLVLDPYFSATKMRWLLHEGGLTSDPDLTFGTVDSWVLWNLTGGTDGGVLATDATNASRTLLFDIEQREWSAELCDLFGVPATTLPEVRPSCGRFGNVAGSVLGHDSPLSGVPISGVAGDQHAALFGQACFETGMTKVTIGTGSFVLMNAGEVVPDPADGLLTTVAWDLGDNGPVSYALEGSVFVSGAGVQWLRDSLGVIVESSDLEPLARTVESSEGLVIVPAFTGLGSPYWDAGARGTIIGLSRGTGRAHLARAMVEAIAFQIRDVVDALEATGTPSTVLRVDGGASAMDLLLETIADQTRLQVIRPRSAETTAIGAATLAGLAEGLWGSLEDLARRWMKDVEVGPTLPITTTEPSHQAWLRALDRSRNWVSDEE